MQSNSYNSGSAQIEKLWHKVGTSFGEVFGSWFSSDLGGKTPYTYGSEHLPIGLLIRGSTVRARLGPLSQELGTKRAVPLVRV